ncbi:hypothetical protein [Bdellovibrio sp. NC01]|uniref:hypothetical protein n=1 Tax=Bdellovibrio sp. NC01 TaxID=2220073 RepID=UPI001158E888|nr:hypothetical protein [Bdellovibrio sp. NC01]QDK38685.1 hypothetical protein DOE51_14370 [Bdellovibrio sp. NC01]
MLKTAYKGLAGLLLLTLTACTTTPKQTSSESLPTPVATTDESGTSIDLNALQTYLKLDRDTEQLGFVEKAFNTCDAGFGFSRSQNCHKEYFVVLHFRLMCRDTEGTISTVLHDGDVEPIAGRPVRWQLKNISGTIVTDGLGYGQIKAVSKISQNKQRIRLGVGNEFLYMRSNEITKVITPRPWCYQ